MALGALELIRAPSDALFTFGVVALPLLGLNAILILLNRFRDWGDIHKVAAIGKALRGLGLESRLVTDALRAIVLIYSAYWAGSQSGFEKFRMHVTETRANSLPTVTAVVLNDSHGNALPFGCRPADWDKPAPASKPPTIIGAPGALTALDGGLACTSGSHRSWRMLYRDEKFVYLFATGSAAGRPLTLALPNTDRLIIMMGGATDAMAP